MSGKESTIEYQDNFLRDKIFRVLLTVTVIISSALAVPIFLCFQGIASLYSDLMDAFELPFKILYAGFALTGFYAVIYRIRLTERQIGQTQKQIDENLKQFQLSRVSDQFSIFIEHRKYVFEEIDELSEIPQVFRLQKDLIYKSLFPNNNPKNFQLEDSPESLKNIVNSFNKCSENLREITTKLLNAKDVLTDEDYLYLKVIFKSLCSEGIRDFYGIGITIQYWDSDKFLTDSTEFNNAIVTLAKIMDTLIRITAASLEVDDYTKTFDARVRVLDRYYRQKE